MKFDISRTNPDDNGTFLGCDMVVSSEEGRTSARDAVQSKEQRKNRGEASRRKLRECMTEGGASRARRGGGSTTPSKQCAALCAVKCSGTATAAASGHAAVTAADSRMSTIAIQSFYG